MPAGLLPPGPAQCPCRAGKREEDCASGEWGWGGGVPMQQTRKLEERAALLGSLVGQDGTLLTQYKGSVNYKPLVDLKKEVN